MSTCRKEGKDVIIFATADDHKEPSNVTLPDLQTDQGVLLPNGEINWNCPCLGGMATGPCGLEFREAFTCFHGSATDPKGIDCYNAFKEMHLCMAEYPQVYSRYSEDDCDDEDIGLNIDMNLTDAERALINDDSVMKASESVKDGSFPKVEEKPTEKKSNVHTEPKSSSKSPTPATGALKINV